MKKLVKFLRRWNELLTLPIALLLFWLSKYPLRDLDPTAGVYDAGILQVFLLATVGLLFIHAVIWLLLKIAAPDVYSVLDDYLRKHKNLGEWEKAVFSLCYFFGLLLAWAMLVIALA